MKTKKYFAVGMIAIISIFAVNTVSWAGSAHNHRMEGFAWGIGAAVLGKIILDHHRGNYPEPAPVVVETRYRPAPAPSGHWEIRREWIPAQYRKVWTPGHRNRHGHWVRGHWARVQIEPGYWSEKKVWVRHY